METPLVSVDVTHGQYDARPTVTCPPAQCHRPEVGAKLYCLVTDTNTPINDLPIRAGLGKRRERGGRRKWREGKGGPQVTVEPGPLTALLRH